MGMREEKRWYVQESLELQNSKFWRQKEGRGQQQKRFEKVDFEETRYERTSFLCVLGYKCNKGCCCCWFWFLCVTLSIFYVGMDPWMHVTNKPMVFYPKNTPLFLFGFWVLTFIRVFN